MTHGTEQDERQALAELGEDLSEDDVVGELHAYFVDMGLAEPDDLKQERNVFEGETRTWAGGQMELHNLPKEVSTETDPSDFSDLDDLLESALAERDGKAEARALRAQLKDSRTPKAERKGIESRLREWEAHQEWLTLANLTLFVRQTCACGSVTHGYAGLMHRQTHRTQPHVRRWVAAHAALADLPNEVAFEDEQVPCCAQCALAKGWDLSKGETLVDRQGLKKDHK